MYGLYITRRPRIRFAPSILQRVQNPKKKTTRAPMDPGKQIIKQKIVAICLPTVTASPRGFTILRKSVEVVRKNITKYLGTTCRRAEGSISGHLIPTFTISSTRRFNQAPQRAMRMFAFRII